MDKYEYKTGTSINDMNELGKQGWRIVPGVFGAPEGRWFLFERKIEESVEEDLDGVDSSRDEEICGAVKAGGWGQLEKICNFKKGHREELGTPHSWVIE